MRELTKLSENLPISSDALKGIESLFFDKPKTRQDILVLEKRIVNLPGAFIGNPYPTFHSFADGMYRREVHMPKGNIIVGAIHVREYFVNVLSGRIWVMSEFDSKEVIAPAAFKAKAGVKHIGYTLEDTVWVDTYKTSKTNVEDAEKELYADSYEEFDRLNQILEVD